MDGNRYICKKHVHMVYEEELKEMFKRLDALRRHL